MEAEPENDIKAEPENDIRALRGALFDTLRDLRAGGDATTIARAKAVCEVAEKITDTARVELDLMRITRQRVASDFLPASDGDYPPSGLPQGTRLTGNGTAQVEQLGHGATRTTHRMEG